MMGQLNESVKLAQAAMTERLVVPIGHKSRRCVSSDQLTDGKYYKEIIGKFSSEFSDKALTLGKFLPKVPDTQNIGERNDDKLERALGHKEREQP